MQDTSIDCFNLHVGAPDEDQQGELQAFGCYWIWGQSYDAGAAPLRLLEWTPKGVADLTTEHASLHRVVAGTPNHIEGLFGYWLISDADQQWIQVPQPDRRHYVLIAGGQTGANSAHRIIWYCSECGTQLGEPRALEYDGSPESFLRAQDHAVADFNANVQSRTCPTCGAVHPPAYPFRVGSRVATTASSAAESPAAPRARVPRGAPAVRLRELQKHSPTLVEVDGDEVALVRVGSVVHAIASACPHKGGPLGLGQVQHGAIACPWHRFRFDLATGRSLTNPTLCALTYDVRIEGDDVIVVGPAMAAGAPLR